MNSNYPTKEEILAEPYELTEQTYNIIRKWKQAYFDHKWKKATEIEKFRCLNELVAAICYSLEYNIPLFMTHQGGWCYDPSVPTIRGQQGNPSIISALHELGHHLFGESELQACRFSISIFMKCFPNTYKKLEWKGHMLVRPDDKS